MGCTQNKATSTVRIQKIIQQVKVKPGMFVEEKGDLFAYEYELGENLGSGAFSAVYKCIEKSSGKTRAVKIVKKQGLSKQHTNNSNKLQEIQVLKLLDHPNIIKIYKGFEDSKNFYIVMEYCEGGELFNSSKFGFQGVNFLNSNLLIHCNLCFEGVSFFEFLS